MGYLSGYLNRSNVRYHDKNDDYVQAIAREVVSWCRDCPFLDRAEPITVNKDKDLRTRSTFYVVELPCDLDRRRREDANSYIGKPELSVRADWENVDGKWEFAEVLRLIREDISKVANCHKAENVPLYVNIHDALPDDLRENLEARNEAILARQREAQRLRRDAHVNELLEEMEQESSLRVVRFDEDE